MPIRDIYQTRAVMDKLAVISDSEEKRYSDIPNWSGLLVTWTDSACLLQMDSKAEVWFPFSHLRKAGDGQSIYASEWILKLKETLMAERITKRDQFWRGPPKPIQAWAALNIHGEIMAASVRDRREDVKLACGECIPIRVTVTFGPEPEDG